MPGTNFVKTMLNKILKLPALFSQDFFHRFSFGKFVYQFV